MHINCQFQTGWALGFFSGANFGKAGGKNLVAKGVSQDTIKHAMIKYCRNNPLDDTTDAVRYLLETI